MDCDSAVKNIDPCSCGLLFCCKEYRFLQYCGLWFYFSVSVLFGSILNYRIFPRGAGWGWLEGERGRGGLFSASQPQTTNRKTESKKANQSQRCGINIFRYGSGSKILQIRIRIPILPIPHNQHIKFLIYSKNLKP